MICPNCGAVLLDNAKYCEECGTLQPDYEERIHRAEAAAQPPVNPAPVAAAVPGEPKSPSYCGFKDSISLYFKNYFSFSGRSTVLEYWYGALFMLLVTMAMRLLGLTSGILAFAELAVELPMLSLSVRRLHDIGKSAWWMLLVLTGFGVIPLMIWHLRMGSPEINQWGDSAETSAAAA